MKLTSSLQAVLKQLDAARWPSTETMEATIYEGALKLERLGLVKLRPCYTGPRARGQCRGRLIGYDVVVTDAGKALL